MISRKEYERIPDREWRGVKVRTLRDMRNGYVNVKAGATGTIRRKFSGFEVDFDACKKCRVGAHISRVRPEHLERVGEG